MNNQASTAEAEPRTFLPSARWLGGAARYVRRQRAARTDVPRPASPPPLSVAEKNTREQEHAARLLGEAVAALTEAGRLRWSSAPRDNEGRGYPFDWAAFVAEALARAAANVGGVEAVLHGYRSWEAEALRELLFFTIERPEEYIPSADNASYVDVLVDVDEILENAGITAAFREAQEALEKNGRWDAAAEFEQKRDLLWEAYGAALCAHIEANPKVFGSDIPARAVYTFPGVGKDNAEEGGGAEELLMQAINAVSMPTVPTVPVVFDDPWGGRAWGSSSDGGEDAAGEACSYCSPTAAGSG